MHLALMDLFRARWSDDIHEEWMRGVLEKYPDRTRADVEKVRDKMNAHVRDCLVTNYEDLIPTLQLPDPDDRHVLAAAIRAGASVIVTNIGVRAVALSRVRPNVRHHPQRPEVAFGTMQGPSRILSVLCPRSR